MSTPTPDSTPTPKPTAAPESSGAPARRAAPKPDSDAKTRFAGLTGSLLRLAIAGVAAATVSLLAIGVLGTVAAGLELRDIQAPAGSALTGLPFQDRIARGLGALWLPTAAAVGAVLVLALVRRRGSEAQQRNAAGLTPWGLPVVLAGLVAVALGAALASDVPELTVGVITGAAAMASYVVYEFERAVDGFKRALLVLALACVAAGIGLELVHRAAAPATLDVAAVVRRDGTAVAGFVVARSQDEVMLIVADPGRGVTGSGAGSQLPRRRCVAGSSARPSGCYTNVLAVIDGEDVAGFYAGVPDSHVTRAAHSDAQDLARRALRGQLQVAP